MIFNYIFLALSVSIDALSIGITYGIKKTKMPKSANIIIFMIVFCCSAISILIGKFLSLLFSPILSVLISSCILIILGTSNIIKGIKSSNNVRNFDIDNSNFIDNKEASLLGLAVAVDASCVSMSCGIIGSVSIILPIFIAIFHILFVNCGNFIAKSIVEKLNIPSNVLSIASGTFLVFIGALRLFV